MAHELDARDATIREELAEGGDPESLHRSARWHMYRAYVAAAYGHLGQGNRVRISDCVIAAIRCRYRAPGCDCTPRDIATCSRHGYTGHKDT